MIRLASSNYIGNHVHSDPATCIQYFCPNVRFRVFAKLYRKSYEEIEQVMQNVVREARRDTINYTVIREARRDTIN